MKIQVTKEDIEKGNKNEFSSCPIALALRRMGFAEVYVGYDWATLYRKTCDKPDRFLFPAKVYNFIRAFDSHQPVKPFSFILKEVKL